MSDIVRWDPTRQPWKHSCAECQGNPEKQVLPHHDLCLPPIYGRITADGVRVEVGLRVWDYDLRPGTVIQVDYSIQGTPDGPLGIVAWHLVINDEGGEPHISDPCYEGRHEDCLHLVNGCTDPCHMQRGMFDGSRMTTRHPVDRRKPPRPANLYGRAPDGTLVSTSVYHLELEQDQMCPAEFGPPGTVTAGCTEVLGHHGPWHIACSDTAIVKVWPVMKHRPWFCLDCGTELDQHDVDANLNTWGVFRCYCTDCIEHHVEP